MKILLVYLIIMNLIGFMIMGIDKKKAKKKQYRVSEKSLFMTALLGGSIGTTWGMHHFRHKTKHWYFKFGMPTILILQITIGMMGYWLLIKQ